MAYNKKSYKKQNHKKGGSNYYRGKQGRKDSRDKRINLDNAREDRVARDIEEGMRKASANDVSDFTKNPELIEAASRLPFASILGDTYGEGSSTVPGIMVLTWQPNFGTQLYPAALNLSAQLKYAFATHANSRNYNFTASDIMTVILAAGDVFSAIAEAERIYGLAMSAKEENRYLYDGVISALGWDPADVRRNLPDMWYDINQLIIQTRQFWIPNDMPIIERLVKKNSFLYTDSQGVRSQMYIYKRSGYYEYNEVNIETGSALIPARFCATADPDLWTTDWTAPINDIGEVTGTFGTDDNPDVWRVYQNLNRNGIPGASTASRFPVTWIQFKSMVQNMINKLQNAEDAGAIYGLFYKAYGASGLFAMPEFTPNYRVVPEYNAEVLAQIENATLCNVYNQGLVQDENQKLTPVLEANPTFVSSGALNKITPSNQILNFHVTGSPSPELIIVGTRMKSGAGVTGKLTQLTKDTSASSGPTAYKPTVTTGWNVTSAGTETLLNLEVIQRVPNTSGPGQWTSLRLNQYDGTLASPAGYKLMAFDWHPFIYSVQYKATTGGGVESAKMIEAYGDFDNYITISDVELKKLNNACLYSAYGVPVNLS